MRLTRQTPKSAPQSGATTPSPHAQKHAQSWEWLARKLLRLAGGAQHAHAAALGVQQRHSNIEAVLLQVLLPERPAQKHNDVVSVSFVDSHVPMGM